MCLSSHAPNTKRQITLQNCGPSSMEFAFCHLSDPWNLEVVPGFLDKLWTPAVAAAKVLEAYRD